MNPHYIYIPILFVIISRLPGGSSQGPGWGQPCDLVQCHQGWNLYCNSNKICNCNQGTTSSTMGAKCDPPPPVGYRQPCAGLIVCIPTLLCRAGTCGCPDPAHGYDGQTCGPRKPHGATCGSDDCLLNVGLTCQNGKCSCTLPNLWRATKCAPPSPHGGFCSNDLECQQQVNLQCTTGVCVCSGTNLVPHPRGGCGPKAQFGQRCTPLLQCEDASGFNLECNQASGVCVCTTGLVEVPGKKCDAPAKLGQKCPLPVCDPTGFMDCTSSVCTCKVDNFEHPNGVCGPPAIYGGVCQECFKPIPALT